jgi:hypothetical protein
VPADRQIAFLKILVACMAPGTRFMLKEIDAADRLRCLANKIHDRVLSGEAGHELPLATLVEALREAGMCILSTTKRNVFVYSHCTVVCEKP